MESEFVRSVQLLLKYLADTLEVNIHEVRAFCGRMVFIRVIQRAVAKATAAFEGIFAKLQTQASQGVLARMLNTQCWPGLHH